MKEDVWKMDATRAEDSHTFQAAMVLLASELIGPHVDRIVSFRGILLDWCRRSRFGSMSEDLGERRVHSESWFDPEKGGIAFQLNVLVAHGELIRKWSEE